jgi:hypothetical protein
VEVAGDAGVWAVGGAGDAVKRLLEEVGGRDALGEGESLVAKLGFGVEEDGFVDEVLVEKCTVEAGAAFEQEAEDVAFAEGGEDCGEAESSGVIGELFDLDSKVAEGGSFCRRSDGSAENKQIGF